MRLGPGEDTEIALSTRPDRWGAHTLGPILVRAWDPLGIRTWCGVLGTRVTLRAFPHEERLRRLVAPLRTQPFLGAHVARTRGDGIELAEIHPYAVGDRVRHIHWRATARRGAVYVTKRHPEHTSDVVLLLDTFEEGARSGQRNT
jgi:uncharacterized protein (DUF58 family)